MPAALDCREGSGPGTVPRLPCPAHVGWVGARLRPPALIPELCPWRHRRARRPLGRSPPSLLPRRHLAGRERRHDAPERTIQAPEVGVAAGARGHHSHREPGTPCVRAAVQGCGAARGPSAGSASPPGPAGGPGAARRWGRGREGAGPGPPRPRAQPSGGHPGLATWEPAPGGLAAHFPGSSHSDTMKKSYTGGRRAWDGEGSVSRDEPFWPEPR